MEPSTIKMVIIGLIILGIAFLCKEFFGNLIKELIKKIKQKFKKDHPFIMWWPEDD